LYVTSTERTGQPWDAARPASYPLCETSGAPAVILWHDGGVLITSIIIR
jgi:hypothetical protein